MSAGCGGLTEGFQPFGFGPVQGVEGEPSAPANCAANVDDHRTRDYEAAVGDDPLSPTEGVVRCPPGQQSNRPRRLADLADVIARCYQSQVDATV